MEGGYRQGAKEPTDGQLGHEPENNTWGLPQRKHYHPALSPLPIALFRNFSLLNLLKAIEHQRAITQKAVQELDQAGLFKMEKMTVKSGDQAVVSIDGLRMIDEEKLTQSGLKTGQALQLAYAHILSQANLRYGVLAGKKAVPQSATSENQDVDIEQLFGEDSVLNFDNI